MDVDLIRLFGVWVFPYISRIHTAYIGEDSSNLGTWKLLVIKLLVNLVVCGPLVWIPIGSPYERDCYLRSPHRIPKVTGPKPPIENHQLSDKTLWKFPTKKKSLFAPTKEGVVLMPSAFSMTLGVLPSITATQLLVVPAAGEFLRTEVIHGFCVFSSNLPTYPMQFMIRLVFVL